MGSSIGGTARFDEPTGSSDPERGRGWGGGVVTKTGEPPKVSRFAIEKMDCPTEEKVIRKAFSGVDEVVRLDFDSARAAADGDAPIRRYGAADSRLSFIDMGPRLLDDGQGPTASGVASATSEPDRSRVARYGPRALWASRPSERRAEPARRQRRARLARDWARPRVPRVGRPPDPAQGAHRSPHAHAQHQLPDDRRDCRRGSDRTMARGGHGHLPVRRGRGDRGRVTRAGP